MRRVLITLALLGLAAPALANEPYCEQPWFIRNLIFDRAGFCFSSPLGEAVFDNSDCTGTDVVLSQRDREAVALILEMEDLLDCTMDTSGQTLSTLPELNQLRRFALLPIPVDAASGCIGYLGPQLPLLEAPGAHNGPVLGTLTLESSILFDFLPENGWEFVTVYPNGWEGPPGPSGWVDLGGQMPDCRQVAG
ncbi:DUF4453 domain-containing protein [Nioella aestuarii]|uniref:DUF4453 domain-containing protein n=1 Tax=Nioella aestuarii TaxID=1662864 RepID=UPI003D7F70D6